MQFNENTFQDADLPESMEELFHGVYPPEPCDRFPAPTSRQSTMGSYAREWSEDKNTKRNRHTGGVVQLISAFVLMSHSA